LELNGELISVGMEGVLKECSGLGDEGREVELDGLGKSRLVGIKSGSD